MKTRKERKQLENFLKNLRKEKKKEPTPKKVKQKIVYNHEGSFYEKGTNMKELARNVINEYKALQERKEALKRNTMTGEEYLRGRNKNKI